MLAKAYFRQPYFLQGISQSHHQRLTLPTRLWYLLRGESVRSGDVVSRAKYDKGHVIMSRLSEAGEDGTCSLQFPFRESMINLEPRFAHTQQSFRFFVIHS